MKYNDYKKIVVSCPESDLPVDCIKKNINSTSIPGFFNNKTKLLFVMEAPELTTLKSGVAFSGKKESKIFTILKEAGLDKSKEIGFTYLCKCTASGFRNLSQGWKYCKNHFDNELIVANNPAIMLVGLTVAKIVLPKAVCNYGSTTSDENSFFYQKVGKDLLLFDKQYFFLPSMDYIFDLSGEISSYGDFYLCISSIKKAADLLNISKG